MDIWFWVNDWYSWVLIYIIGFVANYRLALSQGWETTYHGELQWRDTYNDSYRWQAYGGSWIWFVMLPYLCVNIFEGDGGAPLGSGRPPKEIRQTVKTKKAEQEAAAARLELERVNKILKDEGIEVD